MKTASRITLSILIFAASIPMMGCGATSLAKLAPYVKQSGRAYKMAIADAYAQKLMTAEQFMARDKAANELIIATNDIGDYLASLSTLTTDSKDEALRKLSEGIDLGKRIGLASGLPGESVPARVLAYAILALETTASTIEAVKLGSGNASFAIGAEEKGVPLSDVKVKLPDVDKDLKKYLER